MENNERQKKYRSTLKDGGKKLVNIPMTQEEIIECITLTRELRQRDAILKTIQIGLGKATVSDNNDVSDNSSVSGNTVYRNVVLELAECLDCAENELSITYLQCSVYSQRVQELEHGNDSKSSNVQEGLSSYIQEIELELDEMAQSGKQLNKNQRALALAKVLERLRDIRDGIKNEGDESNESVVIL